MKTVSLVGIFLATVSAASHSALAAPISSTAVERDAAVHVKDVVQPTGWDAEDEEDYNDAASDVSDDEYVDNDDDDEKDDELDRRGASSLKKLESLAGKAAKSAVSSHRAASAARKVASGAQKAKGARTAPVKKPSVNRSSPSGKAHAPTARAGKPSVPKGSFRGVRHRGNSQQLSHRGQSAGGRPRTSAPSRMPSKARKLTGGGARQRTGAGKVGAQRGRVQSSSKSNMHPKTAFRAQSKHFAGCKRSGSDSLGCVAGASRHPRQAHTTASAQQFSGHHSSTAGIRALDGDLFDHTVVHHDGKGKGKTPEHHVSRPSPSSPAPSKAAWDSWLPKNPFKGKAHKGEIPLLPLHQQHLSPPLHHQDHLARLWQHLPEIPTDKKDPEHSAALKAHMDWNTLGKKQQEIDNKEKTDRRTQNLARCALGATVVAGVCTGAWQISKMAGLYRRSFDTPFIPVSLAGEEESFSRMYYVADR